MLSAESAIETDSKGFPLTLQPTQDYHEYDWEKCIESHGGWPEKDYSQYAVYEDDFEVSDEITKDREEGNELHTMRVDSDDRLETDADHCLEPSRILSRLLLDSSEDLSRLGTGTHCKSHSEEEGLFAQHKAHAVFGHTVKQEDREENEHQDKDSVPEPRSSKAPAISKQQANKGEVALQKKEIVEAIGKDRTKAHLLERALATTISRSNIQADILASFADGHDSPHEDTDNEKSETFVALSHLRNAAQKLWQYIRNPQPGQSYIKLLKHLMETIESDIIVFKNIQCDRRSWLQQKETDLTEEILLMEERISGWDQVEETKTSDGLAVPGILGKSRNGLKMGTQDGNLLPEVLAYQRFLAKHGGHYGGWEEHNHHTFVKLRQKKGANTDAFLHACITHIPGVDLNAAITHNQWYEGYCRLSESKKAAIARWKQSKMTLLEEQANLVDANAKEEKKKDSEWIREIQIREEQKKAIEDWKQQKKREQEALQQRRREDDRRRKDEKKKWHAEQELRRIQVSGYAQRRQEAQKIQREAEAAAYQEDRRRRMWLAKRETARLAMKNAEYAQKRREMKEAKSREEDNRVKRLEKLREQVEVQVARDPSRLFLPTKAFQKKKEGPRLDEVEQVQAVFKPNLLPRRHMPEWRRNI